MEIFTEIAPLQAFLRHKRSWKISIGLVPTMGALHAGHTSLLKASGKQNDLTVCSLFVNPSQFNSSTDFEKYPRTVESDLTLLEAVGCDMLFMPLAPVMYERKSTIKFDFGNLEKVMEGKFRPGHFSGVALVVAKLFNIVQPHHAYFGQKDYQQFRIISCLVDELKFNLRVHSLPTIREPDGLAMSSRNLRLSALERKTAVAFYDNLQFARNALLENRPWMMVHREVEKNIKNSGIRLEYFQLADRESLDLLDNLTNPRIAVLLIAGYVGDVRLIDNLFVED